MLSYLTIETTSNDKTVISDITNIILENMELLFNPNRDECDTTILSIINVTCKDKEVMFYY